MKSPTSETDFQPIRMGSFEQDICVAEDVKFSSNKFQGMDFAIDATSQQHSYTVLWTLNVNKLESNTTIQILDKNGKEVANLQTNKNGSAKTELPEYVVNGDEKTLYSPYTIVAGEKKKLVNLNNNKSIRF